jgi:hypothetical protein
MVVVLVVYGRDDHVPPTRPTASEPHVGAQHHSAEKHEGDKPAPMQVFVDAKVGDWNAYETSTQLATGRPTVKTWIVTVEAADEDSVSVVRSERNSSLDPPIVTREKRPRKNVTIDNLVGNDPAQWTLKGLTIADDPHQTGGRTFAAKKLTFALIAPLDRNKRSTAEAWFSSEVPGDGMVETRQTVEGTGLVFTNRLLGFGTASAVTWGTKPDGL